MSVEILGDRLVGCSEAVKDYTFFAAVMAKPKKANVLAELNLRSEYSPRSHK